jgi:trans-aconitate 2-methyltransferase
MTYEWNADDYARHSRGQESWARELLDGLDLEPDDEVLDVGSGDGRITAALAQRVPRGRVVGVDSSADMIRYARESFPPSAWPNLAFEQADAADLPFDGAFSAVYSSATLHWLPDHRPALAGIARALHPGGRLLAQMGGFGNGAAVIAALEQVGRDPRWTDAFARFPRPYTFHRPRAYRRWLREAGLEVIDVRLIPKDMVHADRSAFSGWIRSAWHPYTSRVAPASRAAFIEEAVEHYLAAHPPDAAGAVHVPMVRLQVRARKPG